MLKAILTESVLMEQGLNTVLTTLSLDIINYNLIYEIFLESSITNLCLISPDLYELGH